MEKPKFYTFDPVIYPRLVWIAIGNDRFEDQFEGINEMSDEAEAQCNHAYDKTNNKGGVFLRFRSIDAITYGNVTHESLHIAMMIYEYINCKVEIDNQ